MTHQENLIQHQDAAGPLPRRPEASAADAVPHGGEPEPPSIPRQSGAPDGAFAETGPGLPDLTDADPGSAELGDRGCPRSPVAPPPAAPRTEIGGTGVGGAGIGVGGLGDPADEPAPPAADRTVRTLRIRGGRQVGRALDGSRRIGRALVSSASAVAAERRSRPARGWGRALARGGGRLWADLRPLDPMRSIKAKLGALVIASVCISTLMVVVALNSSTQIQIIMVFSVVASLLLTQLLAHGMTAPLREMTAAARAMASGDYTRRVHTGSRDEVGELAETFNRMAADLETSDRQRRELIANVSHELRTPISALHAVLENVVDGVVRPEPANLAAALEQTDRLGRLVAHLLDLSRLDHGVVPLDVKEFEVEPFLAGVLRGLTVDGSTSAGASRRRTDVTLELHVAPGLSAVADPERLHQVVANLVDNACKHSPEHGTVYVFAQSGDLGEAPGSLRLEVRDEGPGIREEDRAKVFQRFRSGTATTAAGPGSDGGTGLGLAIARWAVDLHGGSIRVAESPVGCRIQVTLPGIPPVRD
jgi:signal transduction histidine kinase